MKTMLLAAIILTCAYPALCAVGYHLEDLGTIPDTFVGAMNASGQAVGSGAFLYTPGVGLQMLIDGPAVAYAISDSGKVTGVDCPYDGNNRAFVYDPGTGVSYPDLPSLATGWGINNSGTICGYYATTDYKPHSFVYTPGVGMTDIGSIIGNVDSYAEAINDAGIVAGNYVAADGVCHLYTYSSGSGVSEIGTFPGFFDIRPIGINNLGQITGYGYSDRSNVHLRSYLYTPGIGVVDLGMDSQAYGLNDLGQVVGFVAVSGIGRPFVHTPGSGISYLDALGSGTSIAYHIDNSGRIVGTSYDDSGNLHVVAWNPIPEPSSLLALAAGLGALGVFIRRRRR
jgi:probable HAF family extracellular repeat protein